MAGELLSVRDLRVSFASDAGSAQVLDGVAFSMKAGEIKGLVGESGCGKTTLARAILGILPRNSARIESGEIRFDGRDLLALPEETLAREVRGREIAYIPQDPSTAFNPVFTIGTQIDDLMRFKSPLLRGAAGDRRRLLDGYPRERRAADRARVLELLRLVQLPNPEAVLRKYPHEVSGGQRQRLMIAMALLPEPKLVIADEPTTALDVTVQAQILKLLKQLARERGAAVLFTTHDLGAAYEICDRITVMYAGQEVEEAPVDGFFGRPSHPYTRKLLDSLPTSEAGIRGIPGEIPRLIDPPPGCRFHPRCERASALCRAERPAPERIGPAHSVRCHHRIGAAEPAG
ncbi:ABC transporter ATP-binding protein [Elioraea sp.]|jgi:peptide/nickel transport system ATP-binding protein|uniref:ABC transporter ATP-binding protein n=1 Tax=Elioraea sp. TaxID=2185103 RepID=UPI0021DD693A|nr:ABC transporter ATP-binding protein [Elioraea sp.]GIX08982.1 MAG: peptide ABC transporter ATP-binding protein [Elioraea sp.]